MNSAKPSLMKNRNLFILLVIVCVLAPGIHYFVGGRNFDNSTLRNAMTAVQILGGIALIVLYGREKEEKTS
jgi:hypothetical protein